MSAIAVILGIALGGILSFAVTPSLTGPACGRPGGGNPGPGSSPFGSPAIALVGFGQPSERTVGSSHWYNFSIVSSAGGPRLFNFEFRLEGATGSPVSPSPGWTLEVLSSTGVPLGNFSITGPSTEPWKSGGSTSIATGQVVSLMTTPDNVSGDTFVMAGNGLGVCPVQGSTSAAIA
jgi:hypothetical protein